MRWQDDLLAFNTMPAKDIVPPEGGDVLSLQQGAKCWAVYKGEKFGVDIVACGKSLIHIALIHFSHLGSKPCNVFVVPNKSGVKL